jgi:hypothetical protein
MEEGVFARLMFKQAFLGCMTMGYPGFGSLEFEFSIRNLKTGDVMPRWGSSL